MSSVWSILAIPFRRVLSQLQLMRDGWIMSEDVLESCILTLELVHREFITLGTIGRLSVAEEVSDGSTQSDLAGLFTRFAYCVFFIIALCGE